MTDNSLSSLYDLISKEPFDGLVRIRTGGREQVLGYDLACRLQVTQDQDGDSLLDLENVAGWHM